MESYHNLLGTMPDARLARQFGVSRQAVTKARKRLGIPVYRKKVVEPILHDKCGGIAAVFECYNDSGSKRYRCQVCGRAFTPYPKKSGSSPISDRPMTSTERVKRYLKKKFSQGG